MSKSLLSSYLVLFIIVLAVLALWYLSFRVVRWDTRRRGMPELQRKAWIAAAVALPLFGFALYLFANLLGGYLKPQPEEAEPGHVTEVKSRHAGGTADSYDLPHQSPLPEPAWGDAPRAGQNGRAHGAQSYQTPATVAAPYQALRMRYALTAIDGPLLGQHFSLDQFPARIGRGPDAAVALDGDLNVSRKHAEVYEWNGQLRIRDLGSMHGTLLNGTRVTDQALSPGDRIQVGTTVLLLREIP